MKTRNITIAGILGFLLWELLYYLGVGDFSRFSHPLGTIVALKNVDFLRAFGKTLLSVMISSFFGGAIGLGVAVLVSKSSRLAETAVQFLRIGLWAPFFVFWAVPYWLLPTAIVVVSLFACYRFLGLRVALSLSWREAALKVLREAILQALLFYVLFQVWLPDGWMIFSNTKVDVAYTLIVLLLAFVFFLNRIFQSKFTAGAETQGTVLDKQIISRGSHWGIGLLLVVCFVGWQLFSRHFRVGSPVAVIETIYPLLASGEIFFDIAISLLEVSAGLILGGGIAVVISKSMADKVPFRNLMFSLLPLTFIVPIMLSLVEYHWVGGVNEKWLTALDVGLLSFYPSMLALWGLRNHPSVYRILLAADDALPYAFLAMLFGETMSSARGLGFYIVWTRNTLSISRSFGGSLLTFSLLLVLSWLLRTAVRRWFLAQNMGPAENRGRLGRIGRSEAPRVES